MRVELEFLDQTKTRIHERDLEFDGTVPAPLVGEHVMLSDPDGPYNLTFWRVTRREFFYLAGGDLKISLWCEQVR